MSNRTAARYRDPDGVWHTLEVRHVDGGWQVLDVDGERERVIDTLTGIGDGRPQADAIARDYLTTVGRRDMHSEPSAVVATGRH